MLWTYGMFVFVLVIVSLLLKRQHNFRLLSYNIVYFDSKLMSKVIMSYLIYSTGCLFPLQLSVFTGWAICLSKWLSCDWEWLAWLQLPYWTVVFKYWLVTVSLVLDASDLSILSIDILVGYSLNTTDVWWQKVRWKFLLTSLSSINASLFFIRCLLKFIPLCTIKECSLNCTVYKRYVTFGTMVNNWTRLDRLNVKILTGPNCSLFFLA